MVFAIYMLVIKKSSESSEPKRSTLGSLKDKQFDFPAGTRIVNHSSVGGMGGGMGSNLQFATFDFFHFSCKLLIANVSASLARSALSVGNGLLR